MLRFHKLSLSAALAALTLTAPVAFAEDDATVADEAATTSEEAVTSTGSVTTETDSGPPTEQEMRGALKSNRAMMLKQRELRHTSRGSLRTLRRTEQMQEKRGTQLRIKERQSVRSLRRRIRQRLGAPNSGIRRQGIEQDAVRVDT